MNDEPGLPGLDRTCRGWQDIATADAAANERLALALTRERDPAAQQERRLAALAYAASKQARSASKLAAVPFWPKWARALPMLDSNRCSTCWLLMEAPKRASVDVRICRKCGHKLGRHAPRVRLAVRQFRAGEWTP